MKIIFFVNDAFKCISLAPVGNFALLPQILCISIVDFICRLVHMGLLIVEVQVNN